MGMEVGSKGSSMATMNVVPLIDILLVLIIIFMVIIAAHTEGTRHANSAAGQERASKPRRFEDCCCAGAWFR